MSARICVMFFGTRIYAGFRGSNLFLCRLDGLKIFGQAVDITESLSGSSLLPKAFSPDWHVASAMCRAGLLSVDPDHDLFGREAPFISIRNRRQICRWFLEGACGGSIPFPRWTMASDAV